MKNKSDSRFYNSEEDISLPFEEIRYSDYYFNASSRLRTISTPKTMWKSGPKSFQRYMIESYLPFLQSHTNVSNPIVYIKRGTTGIAGQMRGVCDVLLLGILHNRVIKSKFVSMVRR